MANPGLVLKQVLSEILPEAEGYLEQNLRSLQTQRRYSWWREIFNVEETDMWQHEWRNLNGFRPWPARQEGNPIPETVIPLPTKMVAELGGFADSFPITREYILYADRKIRLWPDIQQYLRLFARGALDRMSAYAASIFLDAFNGNFYVDATDGNKPLVATNHSGPNGLSFSNKSTKQLTPANLEAAMNTGSEMVDEFNNPIDVEWTHLMVGSGAESTARKILNGEWVPSTIDNVRSPAISGLQLVVNPYLRENIQTGASKYWFLIAKPQATLECKIGQEPSIDFLRTENGVDWRVQGLMDLLFAWIRWQGTFGSTGVDA